MGIKSIASNTLSFIGKCAAKIVQSIGNWKASASFIPGLKWLLNNGKSPHKQTWGFGEEGAKEEEEIPTPLMREENFYMTPGAGQYNNSLAEDVAPTPLSLKSNAMNNIKNISNLFSAPSPLMHSSKGKQIARSKATKAPPPHMF